MSVFSDEWRRCLREQYKSVIRSEDRVTLPSLTYVLHQVGFTDDELAELRVEATMRVEDTPDDFVPDLDMFQRIAQEDTFQPHPLECQCPECVNKNLMPHDADGQPIEVEDEEELRARLKEQQEQDDDEDKPRQLSLF